jgi:hypothetical protein
MMHFSERTTIFSKIQFAMFIAASFALYVRLVITPFLLTPFFMGANADTLSTGHQYEEQFVGNQMVLAKPTKKAQKDPTSSVNPMVATKTFSFVPLIQACVFFSYFANPPTPPDFESRPNPD